jgi:hypothetical protein
MNAHLIRSQIQPPACSQPLPRLLVAAIALIQLLLPQPALAQNDEVKSPGVELQRLIDAYQKETQEFQKAFRAATTESEREALREKRPTTAATTERVCSLAKAHPKDPSIIEPLIWIAQRSDTGAETVSALKILFEHHRDNEKLASLCSLWADFGGEDAEPYLKMAIEKGSHPAVQASACLALGLFHKSDNLAEAEKWLARAQDEFGKVTLNGRTIAQRAEAELYEIRNLSVGREVPEIEGEDVNGERFKLSDYRGKVVLISFWGDW